jgi:hypothetical protein
VTLLCVVGAVLPDETSAQEIDFGKVDKFESLASGTLQRRQKLFWMMASGMSSY